MSRHLRSLGFTVKRKRVNRLMRLNLMGLEAISPKRKTSLAHSQHKIFSLPPAGCGARAVQQGLEQRHHLRDDASPRGFMFLVGVLDWYSRYVLSSRLSNTLETQFCFEALEAALEQTTPEIFNTDQSAQFTAKDLVDPLLDAGVQVSIDGRGRALDNASIERLWRSVKYKDIYPRDVFQNGLGNGFHFTFRHSRPRSQRTDSLSGFSYSLTMPFRCLRKNPPDE